MDEKYVISGLCCLEIVDIQLSHLIHFQKDFNKHYHIQQRILVQLFWDFRAKLFNMLPDFLYFVELAYCP